MVFFWHLFTIKTEISFIIMGWNYNPKLDLVSKENPMDVMSTHGRIGRQTALTWGKFVAMIRTHLHQPRLILPNSL